MHVHHCSTNSEYRVQTVHAVTTGFIMLAHLGSATVDTQQAQAYCCSRYHAHVSAINRGDSWYVQPCMFCMFNEEDTLLY